MTALLWAKPCCAQELGHNRLVYEYYDRGLLVLFCLLIASGIFIAMGFIQARARQSGDGPVTRGFVGRNAELLVWLLAADLVGHFFFFLISNPAELLYQLKQDSTVIAAALIVLPFVCRRIFSEYPLHLIGQMLANHRRRTGVLPKPSRPLKASSKEGIFVSYRRADSADVVGRIYDRLSARFAQSSVFKDVDSIPLGIDFRERIQSVVADCQICLAVIGPRWLEVTDATGALRLNDPRDHVRIELEAALSRGIPVVPVLIGGAGLPSEDKLPQGLGRLPYLNGISVRPDPDFHHDIDRLITGIDKHLGTPHSTR